VDYDHVDVDKTEGQERQDVIEEVKKYNPRTTFPTVLINEEVIIGFKEDELKEKLDLK
jgi:glutaredoxin